MSTITKTFRVTLAVAIAWAAAFSTANAVAQEKKPNILVIMGDDIGMWNIGAYIAA